MKVHNYFTRGLDGGKAAMLVLLDLSVAFDAVEVETLISTLSNYFGVTYLAAKWFQSYMSNRFFKVQIKDKSSNWIQFQSGVPQGLVLGPLLFSIYTALIEAILKKHGVFYHKSADDLQIYVVFKPGDPADRTRAVNQIQDCISEICS